MKERFEIRVASSAMADIQKISRWWIKHRRAAPRLFDHELDQALDLLEVHPEIGKATRLKAYGDVRRIVLRRSEYLVLYRVVEPDRQVWIVRIRYGGRKPLRPR